MIAMLKKVSDVYLKALGVYMMCILAAMVLVVLLQIFCRYVMNAPLAWSEELVTYLQAILVFPGIAYCVKHKQHIAMTAVYERVPVALQRWFDWATHLVLVVGGGYFIRSVMLFLRAQKQTALTMSWLRLDQLYLILLIGAITCEIYLVADFILFVRSRLAAREGRK